MKILTRLVPTPDRFHHGPKGPQNMLFFRQSPAFTLYLFSFTLKFVYVTDMFVFAYVYFYYPLGFWLKGAIMGAQIWYTYFMATNLFPRILMKFFKSAHIEMLRDYETIYEVLRDQKIELAKACCHFYEFNKYLRRFSSLPQQEQLVIHRSYLIETFLEALEYFQGKGVGIIQNPDRPQAEQEMLDTGINERDLGLFLPPKVIPDLCQVLGVSDIDNYEMLYLINFCEVQQGLGNEEKYISPLRLLLFIQLRTQEVMQPQRKIVLDSLRNIIRYEIPKVEAKNIPRILIDDEYEDKQQDRKKSKYVVKNEIPEEEESSDLQDDDEKLEEKKDGISENVSLQIEDPGEMIDHLIDRQFEFEAEIDLEDLDLYLKSYCEVNLYSHEDRTLLIKELTYLAKSTHLTIHRLADFIINQIDLRPL